MAEKNCMISKDFKIVFMGTPDFAVTILAKLVAESCSIVCVITAPDKPAGRGQHIQKSAVKQYAESHQLTLLQPSNLKDENFITELKAFNADLFVVVAFRMLPEVVWSMPPKGTINLHASLLPNYRGAAPINWAIINGEKETGVTTFFIQKEIDTGNVIERSALAINENETVGELHDRLMKLGADVSYSTIVKIANNTATAIDQLQLTHDGIKNAPKIFKEDCLINWKQPMDVIHDFIRGLSPYPAAWCKLQHKTKDELKTFKLFRSEKTTLPVNGETIKRDETGLLFPCKDFYIRITELQMEGKRKMNFKEFLAGNPCEEWKII
jgi:methionyl-tRNA formyltransferase